MDLLHLIRSSISEMGLCVNSGPISTYSMSFRCTVASDYCTKSITGKISNSLMITYRSCRFFGFSEPLVAVYVNLEIFKFSECNLLSSKFCIMPIVADRILPANDILVKLPLLFRHPRLAHSPPFLGKNFPHLSGFDTTLKI